MDLNLDLVLGEVQNELIDCIWKRSPSCYEISIKGNKVKWNVVFCFKDTFPFSLPVLALQNTEYIGVLPHVNQEGVICIEEDDSIIFDYTRPTDIINFLIKEVVSLLDRMMLGGYRNELLDELEGYYYPRRKKVNSFYHASTKLEYVSLRVRRPRNTHKIEKVQPIMLSNRRGNLPLGFGNLSDLTTYQIVNIPHLPLESAILPPINAKDIDAHYLFSLTKYLSKQKLSL